MIKNKHHIMSDIEALADSFNHEYQSVNNEIKIYLDDSEIYIVLDNDICLLYTSPSPRDS